MPGDRISYEEYERRLNEAIDDAIAHGDTGTRQEIAQCICIYTAVEDPPGPADDYYQELGL